MRDRKVKEARLQADLYRVARNADRNQYERFFQQLGSTSKDLEKKSSEVSIPEGVIASVER